MPRSRWKLERSALLVLVVMSGCVVTRHSEPGSLVVPFEFAKEKDCVDSGVEFVRVELNTGEMIEGSCRRGRVRFDGLEPGPYTVVVYGLDGDGREVMDSLDQKPVRVDVVGGRSLVVVDPPIQLVAAPARLKLRWTFGFGSCQSDEIAAFAVTAWDADYMTELLTATIDCLLPGDKVENYRVLPDPTRALAGGVMAAADVQALDESKLPVGDRVAFSFQAPAAGEQVRLSISCDAGGCTGSGIADLPPPPDPRRAD